MSSSATAVHGTFCSTASPALHPPRACNGSHHSRLACCRSLAARATSFAFVSLDDEVLPALYCIAAGSGQLRLPIQNAEAELF